jgi:hypothetical protein
MNQDIDSILRDLYELDPSLKQDEARLVKIIQQVLAARPQPVLDQAFVDQLRRELLGQTQPAARTTSSSLTVFSFMKKFNVYAGAFAIVVILIAAGVYLTGRVQPFGKQVAFSNTVKITDTADNAFGKLDNATGENDATRAQGGSAEAVPTMAPVPTDSTTFDLGGGNDAGVKIAPVLPGEYVTYKYVYKGDPLDLTADKMRVLKRLTGQAAAPALGGLLNSLGFGLVNMNTFPGLRLQSASFVQDNGDQYNVYVSMDDSSININAAGPIVPLAASSSVRCLDACPPASNPVKIGDIPSDDEVIAIANQFVSDHGIPTTAYGAPEVQNDWRIYYEAAPDKSKYYLPENISVVYPVKIDGQLTYDESGNKSGLTINISVRQKKVVGVWDLSVQNYQSSLYDAETDASRITAIAERGGLYGWVDPNANKVVEVELGTPTTQYVRMWNYKDNQSEELLIPSLVFPVLKQPADGQLYRKSVTVPLIREILDRADSNNGVPIPLMRGAAEPAAGQ